MARVFVGVSRFRAFYTAEFGATVGFDPTATVERRKRGRPSGPWAARAVRAWQSAWGRSSHGQAGRGPVFGLCTVSV
jgi:hypothetical protein